MTRYCVFGLLVLLGTISGQSLPGRAPSPPSSPITPAGLLAPAVPRHAAAWPDTFATYVYTFRDLVLFSYEDSTELEIYRPDGSLIWSEMLGLDQFRVVVPGAGVYHIRGSRRYSILVGDPVSDLVLGFFAVDQFNATVSTKFLTYMPAFWDGGETFEVFAFEDSTQVAIDNLQTGGRVWEGMLNKSEHHGGFPGNNALRVTASKPVSALSYGDQGYYIPASSGTFTGNLFYTWQGQIGGWPNDLNLIPWKDTTHVTVKETGTGLVLFDDTLNAGEVSTLVPAFRYVTIESNKPISAATTPFQSYGSNYYHFTIAAADNGYFIGKFFYVLALDQGSIGAGCELFAFENGTDISIYDHRRDDAPVWSGRLDAGGHFHLTSIHTVYKVVASKPISIFELCGDRAGAEFAGLWFALKPSVDVAPDRADSTDPGRDIAYPLTVTNFGNAKDVIDVTVGGTLPGWTCRLFDSTGSRRLADSDQDGVPDVGTLDRRKSRPIVARVTPPRSAVPGTVDQSVVTGHSSLDTLVIDEATLSTRIRNASVNIVPDRIDSILPGQKVRYQLFVENHQMIPDVVDLTTAGTRTDWQLALFDSTGSAPLTDTDRDGRLDVGAVDPYGGSVPIWVELTSPVTAQYGDRDQTAVNAEGNSPARYRDQASLTTLILQPPLLRLAPSQVDTTVAGTPVEFALAVTNLGSFPDRVELCPARTMPAWGLALADSAGTPLADPDQDGTCEVGPLAPYTGRQPILVEVTPPSDALGSQVDTTRLTAGSENDTNAVAVAELVTIIAQVAVGPDQAANTLPEIPHVYTLTVENRSSIADRVNLATTPSGADWQATLRDAAGRVLPDQDGDRRPDVGPLAPGSEVTIQVEILPPPGAPGGMIDTTLVDAFSSNHPLATSQAVLRTGIQGADIAVQPDRADTTEPATPVWYSLIAVNRGPVVDDVELLAQLERPGWKGTFFDSAGRNPLPDADQDGWFEVGSLGPYGGSRIFQLKVEPAPSIGEVVGAPDTVVVSRAYVIGRSRIDERVTDSVTTTTTVQPSLTVHNFPNPFTGMTRFFFTLPEDGMVTIEVLDRAGQHLATVMQKVFHPLGIHISPAWRPVSSTGVTLAPGTYLYSFLFQGQKVHRRIIKKLVVEQ